jgi:hypothetical protein
MLGQRKTIAAARPATQPHDPSLSVGRGEVLPRRADCAPVRPHWTPEELGDFCAWLALNPDAGDVIPRSDGCRKVRWVVKGRGKRGGVRVIYFNRLADGTIWLLTMYAKNVREDIDVKILIKIREMVDGKAQRKGTGKVRS